MGAWLRFLNSRGRIDGEAKIAPAVFARLFEPHQQVSHSSSYGLGFFLQTRSGVLLAEHGGNVPGYTAQVAHVPDRGLSFALLTNQDSSQLGAIALELFWDIVVKPEVVPPTVTSSPPATPAAEARRRHRAGATTDRAGSARGPLFFDARRCAFDVTEQRQRRGCRLPRPAALSVEADRHQPLRFVRIERLLGEISRNVPVMPGRLDARSCGSHRRIPAATSTFSRRTTPGSRAPRRSMTDPTRS